MAGHSKFANIQHRKGGQNKKRAQVFTKIARAGRAAANRIQKAESVVATHAEALKLAETLIPR